MFFLIFLSSLAFGQDQEVVNDGYSYPLSVLPGDSLKVYINAVEKKAGYPVRLFDLSGSVVAEYKTDIYPQEMSHDKPWQNGYGYKPTLKMITPHLKSGVYLWENKIPVIIRRKNPRIVVVYSSNTENAYCNSGGKGLYDFNSTDRDHSPVVSFKRPINLPKHSEAFLRWFQTEKFKDVGYIVDQDLDNYNEWRKADLLMIVGHSEYWTLEARRNFDRFVKEGKNALVLSGNTMWWQVRYSRNKEQLICYKLKDDPVKVPHLTTTNWDNPKLGYPILSSLGVEFPRAGYGRKEDKGWDGYKIVSQSPLLEHTDLKKGDILSLPSDENDGAPLTGFDSDGNPMLDLRSLGFYEGEIVGYDKTFRVKEGIATWVVIRKTKTSGIMINVATTDWCSGEGMGNDDVKTITLNMIMKLLRKENVFSPRASIVIPASPDSGNAH